ncbi:MAG: hypothetical protein B6D56_02620 [Candidatus Omnitrophica bacterium 4484_70.1]|nr:MAG: hypothetical protein B6D56_02620 [Candidatus Omnitrophica bacterium 4484_70.1]
MGLFYYTVKNREGKIIKGNIEAPSKEKALEYLHTQGNIVLSLQEKKIKVYSLKEKVKVDELVVFSRQLTTLIESGIPIVGALEVLAEQANSPSFKRVLVSVVKDLKEGVSLATSLSKHPRVFSELYVSMVEAAETSGSLPQILDRLSVYLEKMSALRKKVVSSLTYPAVVITMAIAITSFLIFKVVPTFKEIFATLGGKLPLPTQILINFADFLKKYLLVILGIMGLSFFILKKYINTRGGKRRYHRFLLNLPVIGDIVRKVAIAKFSRTFATLVRSGVPITNSLEIVGKTSGNKIIEEAVIKAKKLVQEGVPISKPLEESKVFPPMVIKMISVGEKSGKLEEMLSKIAQFYEEQTDSAISSLSSLIEPLVIAFLGIVIGAIVIALFLPIIKVTQLVAH